MTEADMTDINANSVYQDPFERQLGENNLRTLLSAMLMNRGVPPSMVEDLIDDSTWMIRRLSSDPYISTEQMMEDWYNLYFYA